MGNVVWPNVLNGLGVGFVYVPLTTLAMGTLANEQMSNATGIYNLMRNLGGGVGIAVVTTMLARGAQAAQAALATHTSLLDPAFQTRLSALTAALAPRVGEAAAKPQALGLLYGEMQRQAGMWSYVHDFRTLAVMCLLCVPLAFVFKKVSARPGAVAAH
jgi:DHA2 family multidrug resistance protein